MFLIIFNNFANTWIWIEFIVGGYPVESERETMMMIQAKMQRETIETYMKNPRFGSKEVFISSDKNSRKTPPPSIPTSSKPILLIICTRKRARKSGSNILKEKKTIKITLEFNLFVHVLHCSPFSGLNLSNASSYKCDLRTTI